MKMQKQYLIGILVFFFVAASAFVIWFSMNETSRTQELRGQAYGNDNGGGTTCTENPVNVQYRVFEQGTDKPWFDGKDVKPQVGQYIDVNCFAKNGSALLQNPRMTATLTTADGKVENLTLPNPNSAEVRKFQITKAGTYTFTCKNASNTCSNSDQVAVVSTACKKAGCSNQLCVDVNSPDVLSTCEFKAEYACYQQAECKVQTDGQCGFTPSNTLTACLNNAKVSPTPGASSSPVPTPTVTPTPGSGNGLVSDLNRDGKVDIQDYVIFFNDYQKNSGL